jgi:catalase
VAPLHNNQRDGFMRQTINKGRVAYEPNSLGGNCPFQAAMAQGGFATYPERIDARKVRGKSEKFFDHFSQATLFWNSQSDAEKNHLVNALRFELGKVEVPEVRQRMVYLLSFVDKTLAGRVAGYLGIEVPTKLDGPLNLAVPADADPKKYQPKRSKATSLDRSPALSMENTPHDSVATRKVAVLAADGFDEMAVRGMTKALEAAGAMALIVAPHLGTLKGNKGGELPIQFSLLTTASVLFDAVFVPGGADSVGLLSTNADALHFVAEAYRHCKTIAATGAGVDLLRASTVAGPKAAEGEFADPGVVTGKDGGVRDVAEAFVAAMALHRHWEREVASPVPA